MGQLEFTVTGDPSAAKHAAATALEQDGHRVEWRDDWHASVEKGSKGKSAMLGASRSRTSSSTCGLRAPPTVTRS